MSIKKLYKIIPLSEDYSKDYGLKNLEMNRLTGSLIDNFQQNDDKEMTFSLNNVNQQIAKISDSRLREIAKVIFDNYKKTYGVCCFSEDTNFLNEYRWKEYCSTNLGFALEYDFEKLWYRSKDFADRHKYLSAFFQVNYSDDIVDLSQVINEISSVHVNFPDLIDKWEKQPKDSTILAKVISKISTQGKDSVINVLTHKRNIFSWEQEIRLIIHRKDDNPFYNSHMTVCTMLEPEKVIINKQFINDITYRKLKKVLDKCKFPVTIL